MMTKSFVMSILVIAIVCLAAVPATAQLADTPWPKYHRDLKNTGLSPSHGPDTPTVKWNFTTGDTVRVSPSIGSDGTIYVGSYDDKLYAINPNGTQKWNFVTGSNVETRPAIASDGTIYFGSWDQNLYALNPDGTKKWNFTAKWGIIKTSPAIASDGTIYIGSSDKNLYAINPNGTKKWNFTTGDIIYTSPAIASDGTIYVGSFDKNLYAINPDGTKKWNFTTGNKIYYSAPAIASDGTIYVGSDDSNLYAINPDGTKKWNFTTGGMVWSDPAVDADGTIYVGSKDFKFYAINPDGTKKWDFTTGGMIYSSAAIDYDGTVYIGSHDKKLYAIGPGQAPPEPPRLVTYTISNRTITPPQTTEIDVEFSETVSYKIAIEKGTAAIYDWTGTAKNPAPKIWNGTYEANGTVVPDGDYMVNITGTNTTTGLSVVNNTEVITVMTITHQPDLIPTAVWDNPGKGGFLFANETNDITVRINNTGSGDAGAFNVTLEIDSYTEKKTVSSLAAGANINVTFTGYAPTTPGSKPVNVTADRENAVAESNEANNLLSTSRQVYNNGYKGKRWTGGADIATVETYSIKGNVSYSTGNSAYTGASWKNISASWSPADLPIPSAAAVLSAKLYVYYNFDATGGALWGDNTTFNSVSYPKAGASHYSDVKGWGLYSDRTYGTLVYNVTSNFNKSGNTVSLGDGVTSRNAAVDGMILQVVYSDSSEPLRKIWINEGFDLLMADITKGTDTNETIAYAPFTGTVEPSNISSARLIAIAPGAGDTTGNKSNVIFNSNSHWNVLPPYRSPTQLGIADLDVTSELGASNIAAIQDNGDSGGMRASTTILAVEYKPAPIPTPKPANASVSLGASIMPAIAIEVTPSSMDFGELAPGQTSSGKNLTVKNKGGYSINVSAEVTDNSTENLFVRGVLLNESLWNLYSAVIPNNGTDEPVAKLHVPEDYAGVGSKEGTLMFWAKKS